MFTVRGITPLPGDAAQTLAFLARANAITSLSGTETNAYKALINGLVADGTFTLLDVLFIFATASVGVAQLNLIQNLYNGTYTQGNGSFTVDQGFLGTFDATSFMTTSYNPSTAGGQGTLNSFAIGGYYTGADNTSTNANMLGIDDGTNFLLLGVVQNFCAPSQGWISLNDTTINCFANAAAAGNYSCVRTSSSNITVSKNESTVTSLTVNSVALPNGTISAILCNGLGNSRVNTLTSVWWGGGGMTDVQAKSIQHRINAYMTAMGINVY